MSWFPTPYQLADLGENQLSDCLVDGRGVIVTLLDEGPAAFGALCPHAGGDFRRGTLNRGRIDCPVHGWRFDIRSGRTLYPPDENLRLKRYEAKVEDGKVWIKIPSFPTPNP